MATNSTWTVVFDDHVIQKNVGDGAGGGFSLSDASIWSETKFSNIWAIQYQAQVTTDEVEYRDETPNGTYADANLGDFQQFIDLWDAAYFGDISQFSSKWDSAHLTQLQSDWDNDNAVDEDGNSTETEDEKITRLGERPTSYSS